MEFLRELYLKVMASLKWELQDTKYGCNGDITFTKSGFIVETHTNPRWTEPDGSSWKENRCEATVDLVGNHDWSFKFKPKKLASTKDWVILSQLWARDYHNYLGVVIRNNQDGTIKLSIDLKQDNKTEVIWSKVFDQNATHTVDLEVIDNILTGSINGFDVGLHAFNAPSAHELKIGAYWSENIPFNDDGKMVIEFSDINY